MTVRANLAAYRKTVDGMWADPDLTGDLLAVGLYWAHRLHLDGVDSLSTKDTARAVLGASRHLERVMRNDIRRYDPIADPRCQHRYGLACEAPMIRREGLCGQPASRSHTDLWDLDTGRRYYIARCGRHSDWARQQARANLAAWEAIPALNRPVPPANTGGVLRRHLPELEWPTYWRSLDERWVEPPELEPFVRPTFTIVVSVDVEPSPDVARPRLSLVVS
jgi:hypothetical protein